MSRQPNRRVLRHAEEVSASPAEAPKAACTSGTQTHHFFFGKLFHEQVTIESMDAES
jgi:hypothetical protein